MTDREKAIDRLLMIADREQEWMENVGIPDASTIGPFLRGVADMLREQEPVEPTKQHIEKLEVDIWYCGECGNWIGKAFAYCPWCGKKVKWSD